MNNKISIEDISKQTDVKKDYNEPRQGISALTHYLNNYKEEEAESYKEEALKHVIKKLEYKYPEETISNNVAEEALQYLLFENKKDIPFPEPEKAKFKFIDLFAGIGGFRIALQSLGGKCVFTSEWDEQAKKTYYANFGDVPFGDITKEETKKFIPNGFDVLLAIFTYLAFSNKSKRKNFERIRGTLFLLN